MVERWLASAHPSPDTARGEWSSAAKLAVIPLGRVFEAVRLPERVVHRAVASADRDTVSDRLARCLSGAPVIHDPGFRRYYALVPPGTAQMWCTPVAECLGQGTYLGVPRADRIELDEYGQASYWAVPVVRPGRLGMAVDVLALAMTGRCLGDEDGS
ncbi:hypothetical protein [Streptomyces sp. NPDC057002]|uniref:hypothetical protein n=1 Tax=Streptomyces sp. NPDC057002 TaxID=3345992 RepID=UPI00363D6988